MREVEARGIQVKSGDRKRRGWGRRRCLFSFSGGSWPSARVRMRHGRGRLRARRKAGELIAWKPGMSLRITCVFAGRKDIEGRDGQFGYVVSVK